VVWVFIEPEALADGQLRVSGAKAHHLARVLRVRPGERGVAVCEGLAHQFTVLTVEGDRVTAEVEGVSPVGSEPSRPITLLQALLPHTDFDAVLEAGTEMGISRFVPVKAERAVGRAGPDRLPRWRAILESAAEQSHRGAIPAIEAPMELSAALRSVTSMRLLALDPDGTEPLPRQPSDEPIAIAVGPEGGWSAAELAAMTAAGASRVTLGPRILRARLAAVAAAAILVQ
jgi:16S rRNA (uracil1498-N3)-methyltransferase